MGKKWSETRKDLEQYEVMFYCVIHKLSRRCVCSMHRTLFTSSFSTGRGGGESRSPPPVGVSFGTCKLAPQAQTTLHSRVCHPFLSLIQSRAWQHGVSPKSRSEGRVSVWTASGATIGEGLPTPREAPHWPWAAAGGGRRGLWVWVQCLGGKVNGFYKRISHHS